MPRKPADEAPAVEAQDNDPDFEVTPAAPEADEAPKGTTLRRGEETVVAHKPTTVTRLKSEGWEVVE